MWYAEAAELYEQALLKGKEYHSFDIIQKVADAHYFNTNMEKAYEWYNILYDNHGKEMSADNIFKYAHSLKGTGKYRRAKRLMRLYNRKMKNEEVADMNGDVDKDPTANEMVLDKILSSEQNIDIKNMDINTEYSDFSPMFLDSNQVVFASAKDSSFFNTRKYRWNDQPYLDLYVAKINEESQDLKDAIKFSKKINTKYHEASVTFSPDNTTMYFTRNNYGKKLKRDKNGINHLKIYMSRKVGDEWSEAVEVPFNSDDFSTGHPALTPDGKQLYFVSDMPGSIGETDIFVVDVLENNTFSEPKNLGPEINTERKEMFPFINDKKLYFSSDGHTGLGGLDVYEVAYVKENCFQEVVNVGQPINSNRDDFSYIVNEETQKGFFASNRAEGKGDDDIYSFKRLVVEEIPEISNAIAGVVTELITGNLMPQALVELLDENGIKLKEMVTDDNGSFVFEDLDADTKYTLKTTNLEYFEDLQEVTTLENDTIDVNVAMKKLQEMIAIEDGIKKLKTEMIYFDFDRSYIRDDASLELDKLVEVMKEYPDMVIRVESHTDSRGSRAYNKYLSGKRAKSTRDYIISQGVAPERIESATGYGEEQLLNGCDGSVRCSEEKHFLNRRSEFIIVNM
jgi:outer membrane protein OmpA-like peptidoglycan-associated protein